VPELTLEFDSFRSFIVSTLQENTLDGLLRLAGSFFETRPIAACACIWLVEWRPDGAPFLRLHTKYQRTKTGPEVWPHAYGPGYSEVPFEEPLIGRVAQERQQRGQTAEEGWRPDWAESENIVEVLASPMICKGELLGVLGVFFFPHTGMDSGEGEVMQKVLASVLAAAFQNAKNQEENRRIRRQLEQENELLRDELREVQDQGEMVGQSDQIRRVIAQIKQVAPTQASVLITGESGTGKELVARAIHAQSTRAGRPFVKVNCAAIPNELFESEFFGHAKGSFTGAGNDRAGRFQLSDGGTLLLDEVAEIPTPLQGKLLRVLQDGTFERVGDGRTRTVSVRVLAATNRNLREAVRSGYFREDLYYRLAVFPIEVPPLRKRREDVPALVERMLDRSCRGQGVRRPPVTSEQMAALVQYDWPGNIRELQNVIERALILGGGCCLELGFLSHNAPAHGLQPITEDRIIAETEWAEMQRQNLERALRLAGGVIDGEHGAAKLLGIRPSTLRSRLKALGMGSTEIKRR
jgi:transcriptional regulator with GAF, ATPase, and Fis domain